MRTAGRQSEAPERGSTGHKRRLGLIGRIATAGLAFAVLIGAGYAWAQYRNFVDHVPHGDALPPLTGRDLDGSAQDILLIGNDSRAGETPAEQQALHTGHDQTVNTDTMMILHVPEGDGRPSLLSFPRDSWVNIPGHGKGKLNSAYSDAYNAAKSHHKNEREAQSAGILLVARTLEQLTGLHIDHYVQIDLIGFYRISLALGGIQVCLLHAQNRHTETDGRRHGFSGIDLPKGVSTISGAMALAFVRQRHGLPNGDLDRIRRQQYFLAAAFHKVVSGGILLNPFKLHDLLHAVQSSLVTDPSLDLMSLARSFELLSTGDISFETLPNNGAQLIYPDGVETSIVAVDHAAIPSFIQRFIGNSFNLSRVKPAPRAKTTVDVLNGTEVLRLAARNARRLRRMGFHINTIDSTPTPVTTTAIEYPPHKAANAKTLAEVVKGAKLVPTSSVKRVTLALGSDGRQVNGLVTRVPDHPSKKAKHAAKQSHQANGLGCIN